MSYEVIEPPFEQFVKGKFIILNPIFLYQFACLDVAPVLHVRLHD
jgi:hypothetical protein